MLDFGVSIDYLCKHKIHTLLKLNYRKRRQCKLSPFFVTKPLFALN